MPPENESPWHRLGRLLAQRRIELGPRYRNKNLFAEERQLNRRMVWSIETGARDTYTPDTLRAVERAYMLVPGSVERTLAGGGLEPADAGPAPLPRNPFAAVADPADEPGDDAAWAMFPDPADRLLRWIWRLPVPVQDREQMVADQRARRRAALDPPGRESAGLSLALPERNNQDT
jgi:hypothetical protein